MTVAVALAAPPRTNEAHREAVRIASWGPRPAATRAENRVHAHVAKAFRRAGLRTGVQRFDVPGKGGSRNVIGVLDTPRTCLRIVMAHADSVPAAPGADDNASGVGVVMALAPRLRRPRPGCDVWLAATGAEERPYTGLPDHMGALALARRARAHGGARRLRWALSLDEVGRHGVSQPFWLRSPAHRSAETELLRAARRAQVPVTWVRDSGDGMSDHREFGLLGLPAAKLGVGASGDPCRHRPCDRATRLDPRSLARAQRIVERALAAR